MEEAAGVPIVLNSILWASLGGSLIGVAASWLLYIKGRVAGISGIVGGLLGSWDRHAAWRMSFLVGLLAGGGILEMLFPETLVPPAGRSFALVAFSGLLVGYGTQLGSGCTSGHGVCGLARFSPRSLVATLTFMTTGFATATVLGQIVVVS